MLAARALVSVVTPALAVKARLCPERLIGRDPQMTASDWLTWGLNTEAQEDQSSADNFVSLPNVL